MTSSARTHLTRAREYLGRGDAFYEQAADEIVAARADGATWAECGDMLDRSEAWCREILAWRKVPANRRRNSPYAGQAAKVNLRKTKQQLREASPEELAAIIASLPEDALERLISVLVPRTRRKHRRRNVWVGPKRRLRLFGIVRDVLEDVRFVSSEVADMSMTAPDVAELVALLDAISAEVEGVRQNITPTEAEVVALRSVR